MLALRDHDDAVYLSHRALLAHTGPANRVAAALVYRLMRQAAHTLSPGAPIHRYGMRVVSAFGGPGVLDGLDYITRGRTDGRLVVDAAIAPDDAPESPLGRFAFHVLLRNRGCALVLRPQYFPSEFAALVARQLDGSADADEAAAFRRAQTDLATAILDAPKGAVFEVRPIGDLPLRPTVQVDDAGATITPEEAPPPIITLADGGDTVTVSFADMLAYHGRENIGGVALGFQTLAFVLPRLSPNGPLERRAVRVLSAFPGTGFLDALEVALRTTTDERMTVATDLEEPRGTAAARGLFVFRFQAPNRRLTVTLKDGLVPPAFRHYAGLNRAGQLNPVERTLFQGVKEDLARLLLSQQPEALFDILDEG